MLYKSLRDEFEENPNAGNIKECLEQYEKQRKFFLKNRFETINSTYRLTPKESKILLAYFNTAERDLDNKEEEKVQNFRLLSTFKFQKAGDDFVDQNPLNPSIIGWLRIYWSTAWREFAEDNKYTLSSRFAILRSAQENIDQFDLDSAVEDLSIDLKEILPKAEKHLGLPLSVDAIKNPSLDTDGRLKIDVKKLNWLSQNNLGKDFQAYIDAFKFLILSETYSINKRLDVWDNPLYFSRELAQLRWKDRVENFVKRKRENPPALTLNFATQLTDTISKKTKVSEQGNRLVDSSGDLISTFDPSACMTLVTAENILGKNIAALSSKVADHMLRWMVREGHKQHILNIKDPNILELDGGWARFGELSGAGASNKTVEKLKIITAALSGCGYEYESKEGLITGNLLSYEHIQARGRRSSKLRLMLSRPLCPGFVENIPTGYTKNKRERFLIPVVDMPIFIGEAKSHASQSNFQWHLIIEMRLRAVEIYERGGILLDNASKKSIAKKARLSPELIDDVMDAWVNESYLEKIDDHVFFLGARYPHAQKMLKEAGEDQILGAEAGRRQRKAKKNRFRKFKTE